VAHAAAKGGCLPEGFEHWDLADKNSTIVAGLTRFGSKCTFWGPGPLVFSGFARHFGAKFASCDLVYDLDLDAPPPIFKIRGSLLANKGHKKASQRPGSRLGGGRHAGCTHMQFSPRQGRVTMQPQIRDGPAHAAHAHPLADVFYHGSNVSSAKGSVVYTTQPVGYKLQ
jgi:hypothetical protein